MPAWKRKTGFFNPVVLYLRINFAEFLRMRLNQCREKLFPCFFVKLVERIDHIPQARFIQHINMTWPLGL